MALDKPRAEPLEMLIAQSAARDPRFAHGLRDADQQLYFAQLANQRRALEDTKGVTRYHVILLMDTLTDTDAYALRGYLQAKARGELPPPLPKAVVRAYNELAAFEALATEPDAKWLARYRRAITKAAR